MARQRKCKIGEPGCHVTYTPFNSLQKSCPNPKCAIAAGKSLKAKQHRKELKEFREKTKTKSDWAREAQIAVNSYIRWRDKGKPCISCDKPDDGTHQRHASHYRSVGACSSLRFNTWNIWASCAQCNSIKSGNLIEYRIRLVANIGEDRVEWLENHNKITRYSVEYLKRVKKIFARRAKLAEKRYNEKAR